MVYGVWRTVALRLEMQRGSEADLWRQRFWRVEGMTRGKDMAGGADGRSSPPLPIVIGNEKIENLAP
jgi:hypothetical protein